MASKKTARRKMVCSHCGKEQRPSRNQRASRFGLPPCIDCGHKHFEPSVRSKLNDELLDAEDLKLQQDRHTIRGSVIRTSN